MQYGRAWADAGGDSHIESKEMGFRPVAGYATGVPVIEASVEYPAANVHFLRLAPGWGGDWLPPPRRQFVLVVSGRAEAVATDGTSVVMAPGDVGLLEDTTGTGHRTRVVGDEPGVLMVGVRGDGA